MPNEVTESLSVQKENERKPDPAELKAGSKTDAKRLAGAIFAKFKEHGYAQLRCIGDGAIGSGFRGSIIASGYLNLNGVQAVMTGSFFEVELVNEDKTSGGKRTGCTITVEPR